ncbi:MAG: HAD-IIA family hydrolase [Clostridia bacterium]|nr:HAD-IIA family hydrolase [Clostridia bacterium]
MFEKTKYFIIDMDGTFYLGDTIIPGSDACLRRIEQTGRDYFFFSNNSSNSVDICCARLAKLGFPTPREKVMLSSFVAAEYILREYPGRTVYLLGNANLYDCMRSAGVPLVQENPDIVLLGFDTDLTYERIRKACRYLANGAIYLATHPDVNCPTADGFIPDTGSMIELFAASTGRRPTVLGKPMLPTVEYLMNKLSCTREELAFVGDRLETDIRVGVDHGVPAVLVMSGVTDDEILRRSTIRPTLTLPALRDLASYL